MLSYLEDTVLHHFSKLKFRVCLAFIQQFLDEFFRIGFNHE